MSGTRGAKPLPTIFIDKDEVNERVNNYLTNKRPLLAGAINGPESKSAWYSLPQFEELMRELYYLNADGLRIYFGAYNADHPNYPGMMTVVFVPTYLDGDTGKHTDIVIDNDADFETRCGVSIDAASKNYDTIGLCPPSCNGHVFAYPLSNGQ